MVADTRGAQQRLEERTLPPRPPPPISKPLGLPVKWAGSVARATRREFSTPHIAQGLTAAGCFFGQWLSRRIKRGGGGAANPPRAGFLDESVGSLQSGGWLHGTSRVVPPWLPQPPPQIRWWAPWSCPWAAALHEDQTSSLLWALMAFLGCLLCNRPRARGLAVEPHPACPLPDVARSGAESGVNFSCFAAHRSQAWSGRRSLAAASVRAGMSGRVCVVWPVPFSQLNAVDLPREYSHFPTCA